jgi:hypothetical protein
MEVGHDDDNLSIGNDGGRLLAQSRFAQNLFAPSLLAFCLHVSARHHQAQRLNPPLHRPAAADRLILSRTSTTPFDMSVAFASVGHGGACLA